MWWFKKKKVEELKVYCDECQHYKRYSGPMNIKNKDDCYANYDKQETVHHPGSPITRPHTFRTRIGIEDAYRKNRNNNCKDYQPLFGNLNIGEN